MSPEFLVFSPNSELITPNWFDQCACRIDKFLYQKEKPFWTKVLLFPLYLLSLPYGAAVRAKAFFYSIGLWNPKRLPCPVICVGNITVGGTGKTPLVMALAKGLMERGIPVAILSRGYKGKKPSGPLVSDGQTVFLSPEESGDEPFLMAQALKGSLSSSVKIALSMVRWLFNDSVFAGYCWTMVISIFNSIEI